MCKFSFGFMNLTWFKWHVVHKKHFPSHMFLVNLCFVQLKKNKSNNSAWNKDTHFHDDIRYATHGWGGRNCKFYYTIAVSIGIDREESLKSESHSRDPCLIYLQIQIHIVTISSIVTTQYLILKTSNLN